MLTCEGGGGLLKHWDLRSLRGRLRGGEYDGTTVPLSVLTGHTKGVWGVLALPSNLALSWSSDATLCVWDLSKTNDSRPLRKIDLKGWSPLAVSFAGPLIAVCMLCV